MLNRRETFQLLSALASQEAINYGGDPWVSLKTCFNILRTHCDPIPTIKWNDNGMTFQLIYEEDKSEDTAG